MSELSVKYRALEPEDITLLYKWENDLEVNEVSLSKVPFSKYILEQYINHAQMDIQQAGQLRLIIENTKGQAIGCVDLYEYDAIDRRAGIGILIDKEYRLLGFAKSSLKLIHDYAFNVLGLNQLFCSIGVDNFASVQLFESLGYSKVGIREQWRYRNGKFHDVVEYQLLNV